MIGVAETYAAFYQDKITAIYYTAEGIDSIHKALAIGQKQYDRILLVPEGFQGSIGQDFAEFNSDLSMKPLSVRVAAGFQTPPKGYKLVDEEFVEMNLEEKVAAKVISFDPMKKAVGNNTVDKTKEELFNDGLLELENTYKAVGDEILLKTDEELIAQGIKTAEQLRSERFKMAYDNKTEEMSLSFGRNLSNGIFQSTALGIKVDCRRNSINNDLQNVQGLISTMTRNNISQINYVGYEQTAVATIAKLTTLTYEMEDFALSLYQKKWEKESALTAATTIEQVNAITW